MIYFFVLKAFVETNPILSEFKAEILKFENYFEDVEEIPESIVVGALELFTGKLVTYIHFDDFITPNSYQHFRVRGLLKANCLDFINHCKHEMKYLVHSISMGSPMRVYSNVVVIENHEPTTLW